MDRKTKEAVRYLGYGREKADEKTLALIEEAFSELDEAAKERIVFRAFPLQTDGTEHIVIETMEIKSKNLAKNLRGCEQAILLGATLGVRVDMLMKRYSLTDMAKVVVLQACAAALLEEYLDEWQKKLGNKIEQDGFYMHPRFSPGYGDFSILHQKEILTILDAPKKIGLSMTNGSMLTPTKSVTAVIGLSRENADCPVQGCEACKKYDCAYRRI